eukprot:CAMPEP_0172165764 /NCGR_PEP_ID=MMETSP1050-20130122/8599_1 /TAXON_ID=233186 /ORGANISM="Cryptomonas curvata, Strain CCAP979/52" /LENGTH=76 /DNA_ID=CAMNT_0012836283 /DNA_START=30 /DNA_END=257 /DNA_ORIENTATION=+
MTPRVFQSEPCLLTVLAFDARMLLHGPAAGDSHPERPHRLCAIYQHLVAAGLTRRCVEVAGTECSREEVLLAHTAA